MKKSGILVILSLSCFFTACTYDTIAPEKIVVPENVSFSGNVIPIFNDICNNSGCHSTGAQSPDLTPANAYTSLTLFGLVDTDFPEQSTLYIKITAGSMKQYASEQDKAIILKWIQQGALDN